MPILELRDLRTKHLGPINLHLDGPCCTLTGPSGSGKTLLLRAIADLDPHEGQVFADGVEQRDIPGPHWRRRVAYLPAESHWWDDRVRAHLSVHDSALLQAVGFAPEVLDWSIGRLSSGERQRLALVRMLELAPRVLLLDEPTANLDGDSRQRVERLILEYLRRENALALWVTHDATQKRRVGTRHFLIEGNEVVEKERP